MFRVIALAALVLCITKATIGAVVMWNCEVERPTTSQHVALDSAATPQPSQAACTQFPHGHCNFLVAGSEGISVMEPRHNHALLPSFEYQDFVSGVPVEPPRA